MGSLEFIDLICSLQRIYLVKGQSGIALILAGLCQFPSLSAIDGSISLLVDDTGALGDGEDGGFKSGYLKQQ